MELVPHVVVLLLMASAVTAFPTTKTHVQCQTKISLLRTEGPSLQDPSLCDSAHPTLQLSLLCKDLSTMQCVQQGRARQVSVCGQDKPSDPQTLEVATHHTSQASQLSLKLRLGTPDKEVDTFPLDVSLPSHGSTLLQLSGVHNHRIEVSVSASCDNPPTGNTASPGMAMFFAPRRLRRDLTPEASPAKSPIDDRAEGQGSQDLAGSGDGETGKPEDVAKPTMLTELREESLTPTAADVVPALPSQPQHPPGSDDLLPGVAIQPMAAEIPLPTDLDPPAANTEVLSSNTAVVNAGTFGDQNPPADTSAPEGNSAKEISEAPAVLSPVEPAEAADGSKPESQSTPKDKAAEAKTDNVASDETLPTAEEATGDAAGVVYAASLNSSSPGSLADGSSPASIPKTTSSSVASASFASALPSSSASQVSTISPSTTTVGTPTIPPVTQFADNTMAAEKTDAAGKEVTLMDTFFPPKDASEVTASTDSDVTSPDIFVNDVTSTSASEAAARELDGNSTASGGLTEVDSMTTTMTMTTTPTTSATTTLATTKVSSESKTTTATKQSSENTTSVDTTEHAATTSSTGDDRGATPGLTLEPKSSTASSTVKSSTTVKVAPTANSSTSASTAGAPSTSQDASTHMPSSPPLSSRPGNAGLGLNDTVTLGSNWAQTGVTSAWDGGHAVDANTPKAEDEFFWPIVAALTIGIPSVIVFGIAITVIHKKRKIDTSRAFPLTGHHRSSIDV